MKCPDSRDLLKGRNDAKSSFYADQYEAASKQHKLQTPHKIDVNKGDPTRFGRALQKARLAQSSSSSTNIIKPPVFKNFDLDN